MMPDREPLQGFTLEQYPWILRFAYIFGIPALLSVYLIWLMATRIETKLNSIEATLQAAKVDDAYVLKMSGDQAESLDQIYRLLQRICVNSATTPQDRAGCFDRSDRGNP